MAPMAGLTMPSERPARRPPYLGNLAWLIVEKAGINLAALIALAVVARVLGPAEYGHYAYVFSLAALFAVLGQMGLDGLLTREVIEAGSEDDLNEVLGTGAALRLAGYALGALGLLLFARAGPALSDTEAGLLRAALVYVLLLPLPLVPELWLHARLEARYSARARLLGNLLTASAKVALATLAANVIAIGWAQALTPLCVLAVLLPLYLRRGGPRPWRWRVRIARARAFLGESWKLFGGAILMVVCMKVDLVMLRWLTAPGEVGLYAIAARFSEVPYLLAAMIVTTALPRLVALRREDGERYRRALQRLCHLLALAGYLVTALVLVLGGPLIAAIFGEEYAGAAVMLRIHVLALPFIYLHHAFSKWIVLERLPVFALVTQGTGAAMNLGLNLLLIPTQGGIGAAIATVISYASASCLILPIFATTRPFFSMMTGAFLNPARGFCEVSRLWAGQRRRARTGQ